MGEMGWVALARRGHREVGWGFRCHTANFYACRPSAGKVPIGVVEVLIIWNGEEPDEGRRNVVILMSMSVTESRTLRHEELRVTHFRHEPFGC